MELLRSGLLQRALLEVVILGATCGALGVWLLHLRHAYAAESLAHAMLPGRVLASLAGVPLLLDEPFAGVDRTSEEAIMGILDELRAEGRVLLIATHDVEHARGWDRVLCLAGAQIAFGPPAETLTNAVLEGTYGEEIVMLDCGHRAVAIQHHGHAHR